MACVTSYTLLTSDEIPDVQDEVTGRFTLASLCWTSGATTWNDVETHGTRDSNTGTGGGVGHILGHQQQLVSKQLGSMTCEIVETYDFGVDDEVI
jgi:hypothetical protein